MARVQLKDSGVLFDEEQHTYLLKDKYLSGITGMLQRQFFPDEFEGIPKATLDAAAQYGTDCLYSSKEGRCYKQHRDICQMECNNCEKYIKRTYDKQNN